MPHCLLDGDHVRAGLVQMKSECMSEAVAVEFLLLTAEFGELFFQSVVDGLCTDVGILLLSGEKPAVFLCPGIVRTDYKKSGVPVL